jgi:RNA polymerase sigma-70 factor, ECF subfamily
MKDPDVIPVRGSNSSVGSTSSSFLERVRARAPGAWERLTFLYGPLVYGWARRASLGAEDAADVVQEVFLAVARNLDSFRHESGSRFRGWLWTVTHNKVLDLGRRRAGRPAAAGGTDAYQRLLDTPETPVEGSESATLPAGPLLGRALELIRSEFEERSWQAFWMVVVEGQSPADAAALLGISVNAVYIARSRILRRLREELGDPPG